MLHYNYSSTSFRETSEGGGGGNGAISGGGAGRGGGAGVTNGATNGATPATNGATKRALEFECGHVVQWDDGEVCVRVRARARVEALKPVCVCV